MRKKSGIYVKILCNLENLGIGKKIRKGIMSEEFMWKFYMIYICIIQNILNIRSKNLKNFVKTLDNIIMEKS